MNPLKPEWLEAVAKWLPNVVGFSPNGGGWLYWTNKPGTLHAVLPTEMEHVAWLVEEKLNRKNIRSNGYSDREHYCNLISFRYGPCASVDQRLATFYEAVGKNLK